jgi:hypothetical protein
MRWGGSSGRRKNRLHYRIEERCRRNLYRRVAPICLPWPRLCEMLAESYQELEDDHDDIVQKAARTTRLQCASASNSGSECSPFIPAFPDFIPIDPATSPKADAVITNLSLRFLLPLDPSPHHHTPTFAQCPPCLCTSQRSPRSLPHILYCSGRKSSVFARSPPSPHPRSFTLCIFLFCVPSSLSPLADVLLSFISSRYPITFPALQSPRSHKNHRIPLLFFSAYIPSPTQCHG